MMRRDECLKVLARHHTDQIVIPVYQAAFEWRTIKPEALTYLGTGAMGQASSHGLGMALGRPDKRVMVIDGDGSLLMNLGTLVTIAEAAPPNLVHFVCQNNTYEANGFHPIPGANKVSSASVPSTMCGTERPYAWRGPWQNRSTRRLTLMREPSAVRATAKAVSRPITPLAAWGNSTFLCSVSSGR